MVNHARPIPASPMEGNVQYRDPEHLRLSTLDNPDFRASLARAYACYQNRPRKRPQPGWRKIARSYSPAWWSKVARENRPLDMTPWMENVTLTQESWDDFAVTRRLIAELANDRRVQCLTIV